MRDAAERGHLLDGQPPGCSGRPGPARRRGVDPEAPVLGSNPARARSSVDLPAPFGPAQRNQFALRPVEKLMSCSTRAAGRARPTGQDTPITARLAARSPPGKARPAARSARRPAGRPTAAKPTAPAAPACRRPAAAPRRRAARRQQRTGTFAKPRAQQVRHHQSDEADRSSDRGTGADRQCGPSGSQTQGARDGDPEAACGVLAQAERVETAPRATAGSRTPSRIRRAASATCHSGRSARPPISQKVISASANGFGASVSASASSAAAIADTATPARISDGPDAARPAKPRRKAAPIAGTEPARRRPGPARNVVAPAPVERDHRAETCGPGDPEQPRDRPAGCATRPAARRRTGRGRRPPASPSSVRGRRTCHEDQPVRQGQRAHRRRTGRARPSVSEQDRQPAGHCASSAAACAVKGPAQMVSAAGMARRRRPASAG